MTPHRFIVVTSTAEVLAEMIAARLLTAMIDAQAEHGDASVVLTGGGIGLAALRAVAASPVRQAVDWAAVDLWWGDERFVSASDPDRNDVGADEALLRHVPVDPERVHRLGSSDAYDSPEAAASAYVETLAAAAQRTGRPDGLPRFDVALLGMGPEGHVASIFPQAPAGHSDAPVIAVHDCPKPPPTRVTLTFPALNAAQEVWLLVTSSAKASAVASALTGATPTDVPAAGVHGVHRTGWLLDHAAAAELPAEARPRQG